MRARAHLAAVGARPRAAGGAAEARARAYAVGVLRAAGFVVTEQPFRYSALPGRYGAPAAGLVLAGTLAAAGHAGYRRRSPRLALGVLASGALLLVAGGRWLARRGVLDAPAVRRRAVNVVATRGGARPDVWLVAHLDSKSQPVPMLLRVAGAAAGGGALAAAAAVAGAQAMGAGGARAWWPGVTAAGVLGALPVAATTVGDRSAGALDNASGVAVVLAAAELLAAALPPGASVGVLLTSGEELGLAGARAWARDRALRGRAPGVAINVDGVDDDGETLVMWSGPRHAALAGLLAVFRRAGVRVRRLIPGILADSVALADAGWATVTVSRGTLATLARIHTPRDTLAAVDGRGAEAVAELVARCARRVIGA